jgi:hypothetical protein
VDRIDAAVVVDLRLDTREAIYMNMTYVTVQNFLLTNFTSGDFCRSFDLDQACSAAARQVPAIAIAQSPDGRAI